MCFLASVCFLSLWHSSIGGKSREGMIKPPILTMWAAHPRQADHSHAPSPWPYTYYPLSLAEQTLPVDMQRTNPSPLQWKSTSNSMSSTKQRTIPDSLLSSPPQSGSIQKSTDGIAFESAVNIHWPFNLELPSTVPYDSSFLTASTTLSQNFRNAPNMFTRPMFPEVPHWHNLRGVVDHWWTTCFSWWPSFHFCQSQLIKIRARKNVLPET